MQASRLGALALLMATASLGAPLYTITNLGTLPGGGASYAYDINNAGQVVGSGFSPDGERAFLYSGGTMTSLGTLPGSTFSAAFDINNAGQVVGYSGRENDPRAAFLYEGGTLLDLNTRLVNGAGWTLNIAHGINDVGQIVGWGSLNGGVRAYLLTPVAEPIPEPGTMGLRGVALAWLVWRRAAQPTA